VVAFAHSFTQLEDLERVYVDLGSVPDKYDCLGLEANLFNRASFAQVRSAYVRLVNADTNQELLRCALGADDLASDKATFSGDSGGGADGGAGDSVAASRCLLLAKLFRGADRWTVHACVEPRKQSHRSGGGGSTAVGGGDAAFVRPADLGGKPPANAPPAGLDMNRGGGATQQKAAHKPSQAYRLPALAVASAAGVAAAVALFAASRGDVTPAELAPEIFEAGADFGHLVSGVDVGGCCAEGCGAVCDACGSLPGCDASPGCGQGCEGPRCGGLECGDCTPRGVLLSAGECGLDAAGACGDGLEALAVGCGGGAGALARSGESLLGHVLGGAGDGVGALVRGLGGGLGDPCGGLAHLACAVGPEACGSCVKGCCQGAGTLGEVLMALADVLG